MKSDFNLNAALEASAGATLARVPINDALLQALAASESRRKGRHCIDLGFSSAVGDIGGTEAFADYAKQLAAIPEVEKVTFRNEPENFITESHAYAVVRFRRQPSLAQRIFRTLAL